MMNPANLFSKEATSRPLFEPLSEQHERPDEWSGPLGFVIGGMASYGEQQLRDAALAEQYFNAATTLIDAIIDRQVADYQVANAALFLYRHCFELLLKAGLPSKVRAGKTPTTSAISQRATPITRSLRASASLLGSSSGLRSWQPSIPAPQPSGMASR